LKRRARRLPRPGHNCLDSAGQNRFPFDTPGTVTACSMRHQRQRRPARPGRPQRRRGASAGLQPSGGVRTGAPGGQAMTAPAESAPAPADSGSPADPASGLRSGQRGSPTRIGRPRPSHLITTADMTATAGLSAPRFANCYHFLGSPRDSATPLVGQRILSAAQIRTSAGRLTARPTGRRSPGSA
jgi:hypothetical protein